MGVFVLGVDLVEGVVRGCVGVFGGNPFSADVGIDFGGVGIDEVLRIVAWVVIGQHVDVVGPVFGEVALVAAVDVPFDVGADAAVVVGQSGDVGSSGVDIEIVGVGIIEVVLDRRFMVARIS